nr:ATP-binding protein [uncultured Holophaga sp.]
MRPRSSTLLCLAVILSTVAALLFQGWMLLEGRRRALGLLSVRAQNRAQATANQIQSIFKETDLLLLDLREHLDPDAILASSGAVTPRHVNRMREAFRKRMEQLPPILAIHAIAPDGHYVFSSYDRVPGINISDRLYFQAQRDSWEDLMRISSPLLGRVSGRWGIYATRRLISSDGHFAGIVFAILDAEKLGASMMAVDQQHWVLALYDHDLSLVARAPAPASGEVIGSPSRDPLLLAWASSGHPTARGAGLGESQRQIWGFQALEGLPLAAVAGFSEERALAQWRHDLEINLAVAGLLIAGCAAILYLQARNQRSQRRLHRSEAYFRTLFDASPEAIAVIAHVDQESPEVVDANLRYLELFRVPAGSRTPPWEMAPMQQPDGSTSTGKGQALCRLALGGSLQRSAWTCTRSDGSGFEAEFSLFAFQHENRRLLICVIQDMSEIRAMEEQLHQAQKLDALGQLAGGVAHDFNNMLAAILASAEMIRESPGEEGRRMLVDTIINASERAGQLTRKLLAFARKGKILSTPTDVHQIIRETVSLLERTIDPRIRIETSLDAADATVVGDPSQLQNALLNLGVNARDAMPGGGTLSLGTDNVHLAGSGCRKGASPLEEGDYLHLRVTDTGCGIPEAELPRIFEPFFTTKERHKGTGLGLASVFGTVMSHRGAVEVESTLGRGTSFHLYLPLAGPEAMRPPHTEQPLPLGQGRILVIDDEAFVLTAIALQLESLGYQVLQVEDATRALDAFRECHERLSCVLLDMVMPGVSGRDLALDMHRFDPEVPIILMSGFPGRAQVSEMLESSIRGFLQKPFNRRDLAATLAELSRARS